LADHSSDSKIPVLTEVYQPKIKAERAAETAQDFKPQSKQSDPTLGITPEFIARVTNHVRPRLEADITQAVIEGLRDAIRKDVVKDLQIEIAKTQSAIESNMENFIDKTKADLKTELPRMYQTSAELVQSSLADKIAGMQTAAVTQVDRILTDVMQSATQTADGEINTYVEALKTDAIARIQGELNQDMQAFHNESLQQHQALLTSDLANAYQTITQSAEQDLQQQIQTLQTESLTQVRAELSEALPAIYSTAAEQVKANVDALNNEASERLKVDLSEGMQTFTQESLQQFQAQLSSDLSNAYQTIKQTAEQDLQQQLQAMQTDALTKIRGDLDEAMPAIYTIAADEVKAKFINEMTTQSLLVKEEFITKVNGDLPAVQEVLHANIQHILAGALPALENDLRRQLTDELQELLLKVKFVLPN